jgi:MFS family permease
VLPLHLGATGLPLTQVPFVSGVIFSLIALAGGGGNTLGSPLLRRFPGRAIIGAGGLLGAVTLLIFAFVPMLPLLYAAAIVLGLSIGTGMTAAYTAGGSVMPADARATGFGFLTSASLVGMAVSPMCAGLLGRVSLSAVFVLDAVVLLLIAAAVSRLMVRGGARAESPLPSEV